MLAHDDQRHDGRDQQDDHERSDGGYVPQAQACSPDQVPDEQVHDHAPEPPAAEAAHARRAACREGVRVGGQRITVARQAVRLRRCAVKELAGVGKNVKLHRSTMPPARRASAIAQPRGRMGFASIAGTSLPRRDAIATARR